MSNTTLTSLNCHQASGHIDDKPWVVRILVSLAFLLGLLIGGLALPPFAFAHFNGSDAVDGDEIRYGDRTRYDTALTHSRLEWNDLGHINIAPDTAWTIEDLDVRDYSDNDGRCGYYLPSAGASDIYMNTSSSIDGNATKQKACMIHEFGHALGLAHSYRDQVMDSCPVCSTMKLSPQSHDIDDYNSLWG